MTIEDFIKLIPPDRISERDDQIVIRDRISFEEAIIIDSGQTSKKITFQDTKFNTSVTIVGGQFNHLVLGGRIENLMIEGGDYNSIINESEKNLFQNIYCKELIHNYRGFLNLRKVNIQTLEVTLHDYLTIFENSSINTLNVKCVNTSRIEISDTRIGDISLENFNTRNKKIILKSVLPIGRKNIFNLKNSELENCEILFTDLSKHKLYLDKSKIISVKSNNSKLFRKIFDSENDKPSRDGYRQFKVAMITQHDKINELFYKSRELNAHLSELHWWRNFRTWFVLVTSKITNNFGFDWFFPLLWIIGVGTGMYIWYCNLVCYPPETGIGDCLMFMNPTHSLDFLVPSDQLTQGAKAIDIFTRILIGFFIYQFISAFRKFAR